MTTAPIDLSQGAALLRGLEKQGIEARREKARLIRVTWVLSQVGTTKRGSVTTYTCPDCGGKVKSTGDLQRQHGWDVVNGRWPQTVCAALVTERHTSWPRFSASPDAMGCGPLREPWTTAKRFYVMEEFLHLRDVMVPWERKWAPTREQRPVPQEVLDAW